MIRLTTNERGKRKPVPPSRLWDHNPEVAAAFAEHDQAVASLGAATAEYSALIDGRAAADQADREAQAASLRSGSEKDVGQPNRDKLEAKAAAVARRVDGWRVAVAQTREVIETALNDNVDDLTKRADMANLDLMQEWGDALDVLRRVAPQIAEWRGLMSWIVNEGEVGYRPGLQHVAVAGERRSVAEVIQSLDDFTDTPEKRAEEPFSMGSEFKPFTRQFVEALD